MEINVNKAEIKRLFTAVSFTYFHNKEQTEDDRIINLELIILLGKKLLDKEPKDSR